MNKTEYRTAPALRVVYACDVSGTITTGDVVRETPKQLKVREGDKWALWIATISKDTNTKWHDTPNAAAEARIAEIQKRIERSKATLQHERTWLGMVESALSRLNERTEAPTADDAVGQRRENPI